MSKMSLRSKALAAAALLSCLAATACGGGSDSSSSGGDEIDRDATIRMIFPLESSLDPTEIPIPTSAMLALWPVYERLVAVDVDNTYSPMLASEWKFSGKGKLLTFTLRDDVTFTDGTPFDAEAAKASLDFLRTSEALASSGPLTTITDTVAVDEHTLQLELSNASASVLGALATPTSGSMISPKAIEAGNLAEHPVGTGAYEVAEFKPGVSVTYTRRADGEIWDDATGQAAAIEMTAQTSPEARLNAIRGGQTDITVYGSEDKSALSSAVQSDQLVVSQWPSSVNYSMYLNTSSGAFADPLVRQAVNYAIDRKGLAAIKGDGTTPRVQPYFEGMTGFDADLESTYDFDPDRARELLAEAGKAGGVDAGEVIVANSSGFPDMAQAVRSNLADVGIDIELKVVDLLQANAEWAKGKSAGLIFYMSVNDPEPINWFTKLYTNPYWFVGKPPADLVAKLDGIGDPNRADEQETLIADLNQYAVDEALSAPFFQNSIGYVYTPKVVNVEDAPFSQFGAADFRTIAITK